LLVSSKTTNNKQQTTKNKQQTTTRGRKENASWLSRPKTGKTR
jgi:hypothetical protein